MLGANWMHAKNIQYTVLVFNIAEMSIWSTSIWSTKALMMKKTVTQQLQYTI